jgi:hypothetical protein
MDHPIAVLAGIQIPLGDYLATRLVEIAVHCRDLADSLGLDPPALSERCWRIVTDVVVEVAVRRNTPEAVVLALSRGDRFPPAAAF